MSRLVTISPETIEQVLSISHDLSATHDLGILLNRILSHARRFANAEAGSIYLVEGKELKFCYVQNDALGEGLTKGEPYTGATVPLDETSLAGYSALNAESLMIEDAYNIPGDRVYHFNPNFDQSHGYRTQSLLVIPLITSQGKVVGVLQIINARNGEGRVVPFTDNERLLVEFYANNAAVGVERALIMREMILRMIRIAELRDPKETGAHAHRMAGYAAEIYRAWAREQGIDSAEVDKQGDLLRVAAMLHDVGKVAISDAILKKPGKLSDTEFTAMMFHTVAGERLFPQRASDLDHMARDIALRHHEHWNGGGYPGKVEDLEAENIVYGPGLKGEDISVPARAAALADVFDALISPRVYKDSWPEGKVMELLKQESGKHFDPAMVKAFFDSYDQIRTISKRYPDPR